MSVAFAKGHGTENDFVLLPDPAARLDLTPARVQTLCDRRSGLGADGVLRVVRCSATAEVSSDDGWFMDYRNADGSVAEMCGNGVRVFARYLVESGEQRPGSFVVHTRAGQRPVEVHQDLSVTVSMGAVTVSGESLATVAGREYRGLAVNVGNPHLVCEIDEDPSTIDLSVSPGFDASTFPNGVNVEFVQRFGDELRMRVFERGVGQTRACGTGTVATVAAILHSDGLARGGYSVTIPGGRVEVTVSEQSSTLCGPAEIVATGELDQAWWDSH